MEDYKDILQGRELNWQTIYELQRDPRVGLSPSGAIDASKRDRDFVKKLEAATAELRRREDKEGRSIPASESQAMQRQEGECLTVDFLRKCMRDKRYSGEPWERDPEYIRAVEEGFKELYPEKIDQHVLPGKSEMPHLLNGHE